MVISPSKNSTNGDFPFKKLQQGKINKEWGSEGSSVNDDWRYLRDIQYVDYWLKHDTEV